MSELLLSIIVPAHQAERTIERAIRSTMAIRGVECEVIVVNDGSSDATETILRQLRQEYAALRVFSQERRGRSVARNLGVAHALGKWIMFLDADDYLLEGAMPALCESCHCSGSSLVVFGNRQSGQSAKLVPSSGCCKEFVDASNFKQALLWNASSSCVEDEKRYNFGSAWSRLYDRKKVQQLFKNTCGLLAPFPEGIRFSEDRLFNIAYLQNLNNESVEFNPAELYFWDTSNSQTCYKFNDDDVDSLERFIQVTYSLGDINFISEQEADAIVARESLWQFQRVADNLLSINSFPKEKYLNIFESKTVKDAIGKTPVRCVAEGRFWPVAFKLIGRGQARLALKLRSYIMKYKKTANSERA